MAKLRQKLLSASAPPAAGGVPVFRITSSNLDRHRDRVLGIKAEGAEVRVPLLWQHDRWSPAIGQARCYREGDVWVMEPIFDGLDETSKLVSAKVKAGTLGACSIGFVDVDGSAPVPNQEGGYDYPLVELVEVSIVNVPANADAVRLRALHERESPGRSLRQAMAKLLESHVAVLGVLAKADDEALEEPEEDAEPEDKEAPEGEESAPEDAESEPADGEEPPTPKSFAAAMLAHQEAAARMADAFLATGAEDDVLVPLAESIRDGQSIGVLKDWMAALEGSPEEESTETPEEEAEEQEEQEPEDEEDIPPEELKELRRRVAKGYGFSSLHVSTFSVRNLRSYDALL
ncbi:DUF305 domain-containing protein [Myxococcaceae bacterium JPH2]|nr:DUF305 domain-containing protein [Myxococcaceae bacterium JPH2]